MTGLRVLAPSQHAACANVARVLKPAKAQAGTAARKGRGRALLRVVRVPVHDPPFSLSCSILVNGSPTRARKRPRVVYGHGHGRAYDPEFFSENHSAARAVALFEGYAADGDGGDTRSALGCALVLKRTRGGDGHALESVDWSLGRRPDRVCRGMRESSPVRSRRRSLGRRQRDDLAGHRGPPWNRRSSDRSCQRQGGLVRSAA
jgi:hypothetical protein